MDWPRGSSTPRGEASPLRPPANIRRATYDSTTQTISSYDSLAVDNLNGPAPGSAATQPVSQWYLAYYIPALDWMRQYSWDAFPGDLCSGITLACFQIPISLSYATTLSNLNAISGLFGLVVAPLIYAVMGSVPQMVVAPEGPVSLIIGKLSPPYFSDPEHHHHDGRSNLNPEQLSALITGTAGALILFIGLLRAGFLTSILAQSLLRGFITGVGLVMIADQLPAMLGLSKDMHKAIGLEASSYAKLKYTWGHLNEANSLDTKFSMYALLALVVFKLGKKYLIKKGYKRAILIPDILTVVAVSTFASYWGEYADDLSTVGKVKTDDLELYWMLRPKYSGDFKVNFQSSFFICILGLLESTVAARLLGGANDGPDATSRSANREMVALGSANVIGSLFGALPAFGGYGRSKVNMLSGGTTQMSGIVSALVTLVCTYQLMGLVFYLPRCTLSAVIASIGVSLLEEAPSEVRFFWRMRSHSDLLNMLIALLTTFFWSVEAGVTVGVAAALVRVIHHSTRPRIQLLSQDPNTLSFVNADLLPHDEVQNSAVLVVKIPEPLTFANSTLLHDRLRRLERHGTTRVHPGLPGSRRQDLETVIFHLKGMTECDASGAANLLSIISGYLVRGKRVIFTEVLPQMEETLRRSGIDEMLDAQPWDQVYFATVHDAMESLQE